MNIFTKIDAYLEYHSYYGMFDSENWKQTGPCHFMYGSNYDNVVVLYKRHINFQIMINGFLVIYHYFPSTKKAAMYVNKMDLTTVQYIVPETEEEYFQYSTMFDLPLTFGVQTIITKFINDIMARSDKEYS